MSDHGSYTYFPPGSRLRVEFTTLQETWLPVDNSTELHLDIDPRYDWTVTVVSTLASEVERHLKEDNRE